MPAGVRVTGTCEGQRHPPVSAGAVLGVVQADVSLVEREVEGHSRGRSESLECGMRCPVVAARGAVGVPPVGGGWQVLGGVRVCPGFGGTFGL